MIAPCSVGAGSLQIQPLLKPLPESIAVLLAVECRIDCCAEVTTRVTEIMAGASMYDDVDWMTFFDQQRNRVGQLEFSPGPRLDPT
ncbi:hypothetical protein NJ76_19550 [Rhodococcus sp. IITR03]|nr:hypothetical protein NJ76_19550 [Rhodococcus sp. IITR03]